MPKNNNTSGPSKSGQGQGGSAGQQHLQNLGMGGLGSIGGDDDDDGRLPGQVTKDMPDEMLEPAQMSLSVSKTPDLLAPGHDTLRPTPVGPSSFDVPSNDEDSRLSVSVQGPFWIEEESGLLGFGIAFQSPGLPGLGAEVDSVNFYYFRRTSGSDPGWEEAFEADEDMAEVLDKLRLLENLL